jgi:hypothetical protein
VTNVIFDISMSLDRFITASNQTPEELMDDGGERLHEWAFSAADDRSREVLARGMETEGDDKQRTGASPAGPSAPHDGSESS